MQRESLVMIPGTLCDERIFAQQAKYLRRHCNVILINYKDLRSLKDWPKQLLSKLPLNFSVLGFSLGGIWALELLRQEPRRINRIALIASNAEAASKVSNLRSQKMWANWKVNGPKSVVDEASKKYFHHDLHLMKHLPLLEDMALKTKSEKDTMCPKETQKKIVQNNSFAKWIELPRCGHFIPLEHPKKLNQFLQNWLNTPTSNTKIYHELHQ
ncbi:MAG: alpha/beta hydrolase [Limnohabitans sp.]|nr:alpha/beta hydrolase [Limnohabitans sp.]